MSQGYQMGMKIIPLNPPFSKGETFPPLEKGGKGGFDRSCLDERLLIVGLGNPLMGDDVAGIEVVNELQELALPEYVDVIDGGTPGVGLIDMMSGYSRVIVVDAVVDSEGHFPGSTSQWEVSLTTLKSPLSLRERDRVRVGLSGNHGAIRR